MPSPETLVLFDVESTRKSGEDKPSPLQLMELEGRKTLVLGAGKSGIGVARFLVQHGATVALHDKKPLENWSEAARSLKTEKVGLIDGDLPSWLLDQIDLVVISPGVPTNSIPARYVERKRRRSDRRSRTRLPIYERSHRRHHGQ